MNAPALIETALEMGATNPPEKSPLHGEVHWKCVAMTGLYLARKQPEIRFDPNFLLVFACLHDIMRLNDSNPGDPDDSAHGARASELWRRMVVHPGVQGYDPYALDTMEMAYALSGHVGTPVSDSDNPNVGLCWDADRLTLWRVGIRPDRQYLSTEAAKTVESIAFGRHLAEAQLSGSPFPDWPEITKEIQEWRWP